MNYFHEKIMFGLATLVSGYSSLLGALMTQGETRWAFITLGVSTMSAAFLALIFRKEEESIKTTVGRCGIATILGVCASRFVTHYYEWQIVMDDAIIMAGLAFVVTTFGFFIAYELLQTLNSETRPLTAKLIEFVFRKSNRY